MTITSVLNLIIPLCQVYLLWKISRSVDIAATDADKKKELNDTIRRFGQMFAEAAEVPKPPKKKFLEEI